MTKFLIFIQYGTEEKSSLSHSNLNLDLSVTAEHSRVKWLSVNLVKLTIRLWALASSARERGVLVSLRIPGDLEVQYSVSEIARAGTGM